jgi:cell division septal protein FtsQ
MGRETKIKIIGSGIFLVLILSVAYLTYYSNRMNESLVIESISITGSNLLSENDYLSFTKLSDLQEENNLNLKLIKSRFEKHPYIMRADVKFISDKEVKVFITEKRIYGVIIKNGEPLFASENFQMLPVFQNSRMIDIPVLSNIKGSIDLKPLRKLNNEDIIQAYKIIDASGLTNMSMLRDLAEINLRNGGDVVLTFSGLSMPVIFGRNYEAQKLASLESLLNNYFVNNTESDYIDLRFYNDIYIGHIQRAEL